MRIYGAAGSWMWLWSAVCYRWFFFFQAEDGIRDYKVTGVQTCALPICGGEYAFRKRAHVAVRKSDVEPHACAHRGGLPQRAPGGVAHEREAAREHAAVRQRVEQLPATRDERGALAQRGVHGAPRPLGEFRDALALAADPAAVGVGVGPQASAEPHRCGCQPLAPALPSDAFRAFGPLGERRDQLAAAHDARAQDLRAEPAGRARKARVM